MDGIKSEAGHERVPLGQRLMDDVFLLIALGLGVPLVIYIVWSVVDVMRVPVFNP